MDLIREKFVEKLKTLPVSANSAHMSSVKYKRLVEEVKFAKVTKRKKPKDFWLLKHYDVIQVKGIDKLIFPVIDKGIRYYVTEEELCEVIYNIHCNIGHAGRDRMIHELNKRYKNITQQQISLFLQCCDLCQQKKGWRKAIMKPTTRSTFTSRCQLDLVDFQKHPDGQYKYFFIYQDILTKFIILRPLTSNCPKEIASNLLNIITIFGAPSFLQSDDGLQLCIPVIRGLKELWPELYIVKGKLCHDLMQESIVQINEIKTMLITWMKDKKSTKWSKGLHFVQFMKNKTYRSDIKQSPYEAMFTCSLKFGILNSGLPESLLDSLTTEEELENVTQNFSEIETSKIEPNKNILKCSSCQTDIINLPNLSSISTLSHKFCEKCQSDIKQCEETDESGEQQKKKIKLESDPNVSNPAVDDSVNSSESDEDKDKTDAKNTLPSDLKITEEKLHQLSTQNEALKQLYIKSQLALCHEKLLALEDIPKECTSLETMSSQFLDYEQSCHCTKKCKTKRCFCFKNGKMCNIKCHENRPCYNKR